jgi:hypothetical protein
MDGPFQSVDTRVSQPSEAATFPTVIGHNKENVMKSFRMMHVVLVVSLVGLTGTVRADTANLIPNGDFTDDMTGWAGGTWNADAGSPDGPSASFIGYGWMYQPAKVTAPPLVEGQQYRASFLAKLQSDDGNANDAVLYALTGTAANQVTITPTLDGTWRQYSIEFTASAADVGQAYEVGFLNGWGYQNHWDGATAQSTFGIDSVSFTAVPEPSTLALIGTALCGLLAYAWRKQK